MSSVFPFELCKYETQIEITYNLNILGNNIF